LGGAKRTPFQFALGNKNSIMLCDQSLKRRIVLKIVHDYSPAGE
jgi:hypothetical protein